MPNRYRKINVAYRKRETTTLILLREGASSPRDREELLSSLFPIDTPYHMGYQACDKAKRAQLCMYHLFWNKCLCSMDDESDNGRRDGEGDRINDYIDVRGWFVLWSSQCNHHRARKENLEGKIVAIMKL